MKYLIFAAIHVYAGWALRGSLEPTIKQASSAIDTIQHVQEFFNHVHP